MNFTLVAAAPHHQDEKEPKRRWRKKIQRYSAPSAVQCNIGPLNQLKTMANSAVYISYFQCVWSKPWQFGFHMCIVFSAKFWPHIVLFRDNFFLSLYWLCVCVCKETAHLNPDNKCNCIQLHNYSSNLLISIQFSWLLFRAQYMLQKWHLLISIQENAFFFVIYIDPIDRWPRNFFNSLNTIATTTQKIVKTFPRSIFHLTYFPLNDLCCCCLFFIWLFQLGICIQASSWWWWWWKKSGIWIIKSRKYLEAKWRVWTAQASHKTIFTNSNDGNTEAIAE